MKRLANFLLGMLLALTTAAQAPQGFNYQAVIRNTEGEPLPEQAVSVRLTLQNEDGSTHYYAETHVVTTSPQGVISLIVGGGTPVEGDLQEIPWEMGSLHLAVEVDPSGGSNFDLMGTSPLLAVPYALFSLSGEPGADGVGITSITDSGDGTLTIHLSDDTSYTTSDLTGPIGPMGPAGTGLNNQGAWIEGETYEQGDYVFAPATADPLINSMWIAQAPETFTSTLPPSEDPVNWVEFQAPQGETGPQGPQGIQGPQGEIGPEGPLVAGTLGQTLFHDGTAWAANSNLFNANTNVGIGTDIPSEKLEVTGNIKAQGRLIGQAVEVNQPLSEEEPIFVVRNSAGQIVFAVYEGGVRAYVDDTGKQTRGGFAVGGLSDQTKQGVEYLRVTPDSVRINIKTPTTKQTRGGFAVGGLSDQTKMISQNLLYISPDSARIYIDTSSNSKQTRGGFAVGGLSDQTKGSPLEFLRITPDSVRFNIKTPTTKQTRGGFAVGGLSDQTKMISQNLLYISPDSARIYIDPASSNTKQTRGGFAVGGLSDQTKGSLLEFLRITPDSARIYVNNSPSSKQTRGGFAVGGLSDQTKQPPSNFVDLTPENYFIGHESGSDNSLSGLYNSTLGYQTGKALTTGRENVFIGYQAGLTNTSGSWNTFIGFETGLTSNSNYNSFIGYKAGRANTDGQYNSFMGYNTGLSNTSGSSNVFIGNESGLTNTTGGSNVFLGNLAGHSNNASNNVFLGNESGKTNNSGTNNVFLGYKSGFSNTIGNNNTFLGNVAGYFNTEGENNVFLGDSAGYFNSIGVQNIFLGNGSGKANSSGDYNSFIGFRSGHKNTVGTNNAFIGYEAGYSNLEGDNNAFIGYRAGWSTWKGSRNVFIGYEAGFSNTGDYSGPTQPGNNNIYIGVQSGHNNMTGRNNVYIGEQAGKGLSPINIGSPPIFNVYIGYQAGFEEYQGTHNTFIGYQAGYKNKTGTHLTFIGYKAGYSEASGKYNTFIGYNSGVQHTGGNDNLFLGSYSGFSNLTGVGNVFIGCHAGRFETGSSKLFIDNQNRTNEANARNNSMIYGEFNSTAANQVLRINAKVGILLTTNPTEALEINGNVKATAFIATATGTGDYKYNKTLNMIVPDYVFDKHFEGKSANNPIYKMLSINELRQFISKNRHLPRVPSRAEIERDGAVNIQGLSMITLEKVEEATLYILDLESKTTAQQEQIEEQQKLIDELKYQIEDNEKRLKNLESLFEQLINP